MTAAVQKEVQSVPSVVETETRSYTSALAKTFAAALASRKIRGVRQINLAAFLSVVWGINPTAFGPIMDRS